MLVAMTQTMMVACGGDDSDGGGSISLTPSSVVMYYDGTQQLKADGATNWLSEDEFVAKVDQNGLVSGRHVGTTTILATNGNSKGTCEVTIKPKYSLVDTPLFKWGASKSAIQSDETHKIYEMSNLDALVYDYTYGTTACLVMYVFDNDKLKSVNALLNKSMYATAGYYLLERYQPVGIGSGTDVYFIDAMTMEEAKTAGMLDYLDWKNTTMTSIFYTDISIIKQSSAPKRSLLQRFKITEDIEKVLLNKMD